MSTTVVSAPGKVLIAGGYLVLDPAYTGVVVSTSSRFYTVISDGNGFNPGRVTVKSPQFTDGLWEYDVNVKGEEVEVVQVQEGEHRSILKPRNKFVQLAIQRSLLLALELKGAASLESSLSKGLNIYILGANDFYSQRSALASLNLPRTLEALHKLTPFRPCNVPISQVHKTGLGSSAALITSLVCALLLHAGVVSTSELSKAELTHDRKLVHNAAQYVHCLAQGKVGSGFDVASAVFGSQLYRKFGPAVLEPLMGDSVHAKLLAETLRPENPKWDHEVKPFRLPPGLRLMLADVDAGSDTPSLIGKVLSWRKNNVEEALHVWTAISEANSCLAVSLNELSELNDADPATYTAVFTKAAALIKAKWSTAFEDPASDKIVNVLSEVATATEDIRSGMRQMGILADVPIEPDEQCRLLDACIAVPGVIGGGVPGAGGYDAIWLLVIDGGETQGALSTVEGVWQSWTEMSVSPLMAWESHEGGARVEKIENVPGLVEAIGNE
ncbi:phosphomevalonate kinase [Dacryopinax primogenitus]|uniref:Phosphomevalonate kinase n=1 Tax=Dacryopinax primogenitus (strain DJM 731) TaxID=1858805 RepID=M5GDA4_DACPD|nr:phosphomevalonate kinase [Dacryopinax primogenitus]EJU04392.1 phosphomevalonate kinase [Dacryopinax primogenitus]